MTFSDIVTRTFKRKLVPVNVYVIEEQHPNHWAKRGDIHLLYRHGHKYANVPELGVDFGAAKTIDVADCEEL